MKKVFTALALALVLSSCTNENTAPSTPVSNNNEKQVIDVAKKDNPIADKEIEMQTESAEQEVVDNDEEITEENPDSKGNAEESEDAEEIEEENQEEDNKDEESEEESSDTAENNVVSKDDYFFMPYSFIVTVDENNEVVDERGEAAPSEAAGIYEYVKYSNNIFTRKDITNETFQIVRMDKDKITTLVDLPKGEELRPMGLVDDKIYGFHEVYVENKEHGYPVMDYEKSAIAYVDLTTGEIHDFTKTYGLSTGTFALADTEIQFSIHGDDEANAYNYDLYKLDITKGLDQDIELVEKNFDLQYLFGQKRFVDGKAEYNIWRADNEFIYADGGKYKFLWAETGFQDFVGNNLFSFTDVIDQNPEGAYKPFTIHLTVTNLTTGNDVLDENIRGMKLKDGKLYYLTEDVELKSVDLDL